MQAKRNPLTAVYAVDAHTAYAVGYGGTILKYGKVEEPPQTSHHSYLPLCLGASS